MNLESHRLQELFFACAHRGIIVDQKYDRLTWRSFAHGLRCPFSERTAAFTSGRKSSWGQFRPLTRCVPSASSRGIVASSRWGNLATRRPIGPTSTPSEWQIYREICPCGLPRALQSLLTLRALRRRAWTEIPPHTTTRSAAQSLSVLDLRCCRFALCCRPHVNGRRSVSRGYARECGRCSSALPRPAWAIASRAN
jgi:hypothetical protein